MLEDQGQDYWYTFLSHASPTYLIKTRTVWVVFFSDITSVLKIFLQVLTPLFSSAFHLLETVLFHPELLLFFSVSHPTLSHLPSQIITSDQYPLPRNLFSLLRHSSLFFNLLHLMVFLSTHPSNKPMKRGIDNSYFLHLLSSEQYQVGRTQVKSRKTPHWCVVMCHRAKCYHLVLPFLFQLTQTEQNPAS